MIRIDEAAPQGVVIAEAIGRVTADDYDERLIPAIESAGAGKVKLGLLLVLGPEFEGYAGEAALEDAKLGIHHWTTFQRIGLVSDHAAYRTVAQASGFLIPGEVRTFSMADLDEARAWVSEALTAD